ncbi:MAG: SDR family NAD(P)-dependent oxidoreductase, partial [Eubacteriales bacterium]
MLHKTVLITGASRGIGKATATIFAQSGYHLVLICYTSIKELEEFAQELRRIWNISVHTFSVDLSDSSNIKELFEIQMPSKGVPPIDILINNAGISHIGLFTQLSEPKLLEILHTNLISTMLCSQYVLPHMIQIQSGRIINISSVWGNVGASMEVAYSTSKAGLNGFTRALAKEVAP